MIHSATYCGAGSSVGIATGYGAGRSGDWIPVGARFSAPFQTGPGAHPASCIMGTRSFPGVKSGWGVPLTRHPLLMPWSWKSIAIPLLPLWAIRPVQSLSACTRVNFTSFTQLHVSPKWGYHQANNLKHIKEVYTQFYGREISLIINYVTTVFVYSVQEIKFCGNSYWNWNFKKFLRF